jgi:hypothetical protein
VNVAVHCEISNWNNGYTHCAHRPIILDTENAHGKDPHIKLSGTRPRQIGAENPLHVRVLARTYSRSAARQQCAPANGNSTCHDTTHSNQYRAACRNTKQKQKKHFNARAQEHTHTRTHAHAAPTQEAITVGLLQFPDRARTRESEGAKRVAAALHALPKLCGLHIESHMRPFSQSCKSLCDGGNHAVYFSRASHNRWLTWVCPLSRSCEHMGANDE